MVPTPKEAPEKREEKSTQARGSRRLPAERRARKRELDRQAQYDNRQKTKGYIAHLESIIESLKQPNGSDTWITQIEEKRKLNSQLAATLRSIGRMAEATLRVTDLESQPTKRNESEESNTPEEGGSLEQSEELISGPLTIGNGPTTDNSRLQNERPQGSQSHDGFLLNMFSSFAEEPWQIIENSLPRAMPISRMHHYCDHRWLSTKRLMLQCKTIQNYPIVQEGEDAGIPVQAITLGWDTVERIYTLNPLWRILRQTDEGIFSTCTPSHRLAAMVLMHMEMKYIVNPSHENLMALPAFMRPRPCQRFVEHNIAVDFFPWPGLREQLIFCEHDFCSNTFARVYHENHNFGWPFEFRDTYVKNQHTGLLELSRTFQEKLYDLQSWTMDAPFFDTFPQLRGEIPMSNMVSNLPDLMSSAQRPSIPNSDYIRSQIPIHTQHDASSQMQEITSTLDQTFPIEPAGLFWVEQLQ